ncbi:synaptonemal complex protein 1-like [Rutidosis leptorrhynchoides]|uniref:synaptonemal complex protein 1-like n=1 Tax=Rutidosis leptorrhynchoides TaxID=125765 RepID=UPI003A995197
MSKLVGLSGMKSLDQFKSSLGSSSSGAAKSFQISSRQPSYSNSNSSGSFANLKLAAEKLAKEQASAKTDLDLANSKIKKLSDTIHALEEKLQNAYNENAQLKVKHREDEKLWRGLESKFCSTKTMCNQLTETLQTLADQVQNAEKDKVFFSNKFSDTSVALDNLNSQMKSLSLRLESSEDTIRNRDRQLTELAVGKENLEKQLSDEHCKVLMLINERDNLTKTLQATVASNESTIESLNSRLNELQLDIISKEDRLKNMHELCERKEKEITNLIDSNKKFTEQLDKAMQENASLANFVNMMAVKLADLDKQSLAFWEKVLQVDVLFTSCFDLVQEEKRLVSQKAQQSYDLLHTQLLNTTSEKDALQLVNQEQKNKISELQNDLKLTMAQHAEECHLKEEKVQKLESEVQALLSKKAELDNLVTTLEDKIRSISEASRISELQMQDFQLKYSESESGNKETIKNLQSEIDIKKEEIDTLRDEVMKHEQRVDSLEKQVNELHSLIQEKEQVVLEIKEREKQLEDQNSEARKLLVEAEGNLTEAKKQYDQMLNSKQIELSRHLKEISQRNDQAINEIRRKYEAEKLECVTIEKEKAEKAIVDMEKKCDRKLSECIEESNQKLIKIEGEHTALVNKIRMENDKKEADLRANHSEELQKLQLQAENKLKENTKLLKNQHEAELREMRSQHDEECRHLEEELNLQKDKEERQKALLQLQLKVIGDQPQEDQEVTSRKACISNITHTNFKTNKNNLVNDPYMTATQPPVSKIVKKTEKAKPASVINIPKHSKKVTHHEYEVETSNGTITKRRKTKSTIMFQDEKKNKRRTPRVTSPRNAIARMKGGSQQNPPNIGDLFTEGSLNPYVDDPYAFD